MTARETIKQQPRQPDTPKPRLTDLDTRGEERGGRPMGVFLWTIH